jgi:hypothetical protein
VIDAACCSPAAYGSMDNAGPLSLNSMVDAACIIHAPEAAGLQQDICRKEAPLPAGNAAAYWYMGLHNVSVKTLLKNTYKVIQYRISYFPNLVKTQLIFPNQKVTDGWKSKVKQSLETQLISKRPDLMIMQYTQMIL